MKTIFLFVIGLHLALSNMSGQNDLRGIRQQIEQAFLASFGGGNSAELNGIIARLENDDSPLARYWQAYAQYYESIFYLKTGNKEKSETLIHQGVDILSKLENKNSEDYALLVIMQNFSLQFIANGTELWSMSEKVNQNVEKAIRTDPNNLRAYYAAAANDFYTPEQFGGGAKAEEYLLKAITLDDRTADDDSLPAWGKDQTYQMLVTLYLRKGNKKLAKKYLKEGLRLYPDHYGLRELAQQMKE